MAWRRIVACTRSSTVSIQLFLFRQTPISRKTVSPFTVKAGERRMKRERANSRLMINYYHIEPNENWWLIFGAQLGLPFVFIKGSFWCVWGGFVSSGTFSKCDCKFGSLGSEYRVFSVIVRLCLLNCLQCRPSSNVTQFIRILIRPCGFIKLLAKWFQNEVGFEARRSFELF